MSTRDEIQDLAAGYALGVLDEADRRRVEAMLAAGDAELESAVRDFEEAGALLAHSAPAAAPSAALRSRVLAAARAEGGEAAAPARVVELTPDRRAPSPLWTFGWVAAAAALAVVSFMSWRSAQRLEADLVATREQMARLESRLTEERQWAELLTSTSARQVRLAATPAGDPQLSAVALYDPQSQRAVVTFERFAAPSGHDYELWAIRDGKPASLGVIHTGADGRAVVRLEGVGSAEALGAFAVSLEAAGGSPSKDAPSGPVVMVGALAGS